MRIKFGDKIVEANPGFMCRGIFVERIDGFTIRNRQEYTVLATSLKDARQQICVAEGINVLTVHGLSGVLTPCWKLIHSDEDFWFKQNISGHKVIEQPLVGEWRLVLGDVTKHTHALTSLAARVKIALDTRNVSWLDNASIEAEI